MRDTKYDKPITISEIPKAMSEILEHSSGERILKALEKMEERYMMAARIYPLTADEFIDMKSSIYKTKDPALRGTRIMYVSDVHDMINRYFTKSNELSAEDFVSAIKTNIDNLLQKETSDKSEDTLCKICLEFTTKFIDEFVNTAVEKTDSEKKYNGLIGALSDTVSLMNSSDYKDRFKAEYVQLLLRRNSLKAMLEKWDNKELNFIPTCPRSTYDLQLRAMNDYLAVLEMRAKIEDIVL